MKIRMDAVKDATQNAAHFEFGRTAAIPEWVRIEE